MIANALICPLLAAASMTVVPSEPDPGGIQGDAPLFNAPVMLTGGDKPLGKGLLYPSPALYDIDQDGTTEILLGDLWGKLHVANPSSSKRSLAWSETKPLEGADGNVLEFNNW